MLTTSDAAKLLNVSSQTVLNWIEREEIPFIQLPGGGSRKRREFRIPLRGLMQSLSGNYDADKTIEDLIVDLGLDAVEDSEDLRS